MVDDEFFRQLAGGLLADGGPAAGSAPPKSARPQHEDHRRPRERPAASGTRGHQPRRDPSWSSPLERARGGRARLVAVAAIAVVVVAVAVLLLGSDGHERATPLQVRTAVRRGGPIGRPATGAAHLTAFWRAGSRQGQTLVVPWRAGGRVGMAGRLTTVAGRPVADARIGVLAADASAPEQGSRAVGELRTDRWGRFATAVALDSGAPRKPLTFTYVAPRGDALRAVTARVRLDVVGTISAHVSTREAQRRSSVPVAGRCPGGASVQLLIRQPGEGKWRISSVARATSRGRWEASVYIPSSAPRGIFHLRARLLGSDRRGFLSAETDPIAIRVR